MRSYQYFPYLERQGMTIQVKPLFGDEYLQQLYAGKKPIGIIIKSYLKRLAVLFTVFGYDKVVIEKELFPYFPAVFELVLSRLGLKYVVDYDDAIFHNYNMSSNPAMKLMRNKIKHVMRYSAAVTAGNQYLSDYATAAGARNVYVIPTVIDVTRYRVKEAVDKSEGLTIGWVGSPTTLKYLKKIAPVLSNICEKYDARIHIIGGKAGIGLGKYEKVIEWTEASEGEAIRDFDMGVMPLESSPWEKGKCGYKLIQYMGCGLPVIASPVGVNVDIITEGYNGYLASTETEWFTALERYITNAHLRKQHGENGRLLVVEKYSVDVTAITLSTILSV
jgi:glycosyltransferase involved in cell wall biosynthesis